MYLVTPTKKATDANAKTVISFPDTLLLYKCQPSLQPPGVGGVVGMAVALMLLLCRWQMKLFGKPQLMSFQNPAEEKS